MAKHVYTDAEKALIFVACVIMAIIGIVNYGNSNPSHHECTSLRAGDRAVCEQLHTVVDSGSGK
jgi:hypothetical protein